VSIQGPYLNVGDARAFVGNAERHRLRIFLDKRSIEVFADDGAAAVYTWLDAGQDDLGIGVYGQVAAGRGFPPGGFGGPPPGGLGGPPPAGGRGPGGPAGSPNRQPPKLESLKIWPMHGARFTLDRFKV
jgi:Glycosyl hydrolases family 32 C terminal